MYPGVDLDRRTRSWLLTAFPEYLSEFIVRQLCGKPRADAFAAKGAAAAETALASGSFNDPLDRSTARAARPPPNSSCA